MINPWIARNLVYRPAAWLRGEPVFSILREYERSQYWKLDELVAYQHSHLERVLRHAVARTSFYSAAARAAGLNPEDVKASDLARLPIVRKQDLVTFGSDMRVWRLPGTTTWKTTGGSTGVPVRVRKNRFATACEQAASWRSYAWWGIQPGDVQARFWGTRPRSRAHLRSLAVDTILNRVRFSAFAFEPADLRSYFEQMRSVRPHWVYGYVSMLSVFASFCESEGLPLADLGVKAVVTTSEVLSPGDRHLLTRAFSAPVCNEYGCGEVGAIMYECPKGTLHLMAENLLAELQPDPTPNEPNACRIVVTDLHNTAMPLIRYEVGDRVVPSDACVCGRTLPAFSRVFGRAYDLITATDGTSYHGEFFLYVLEDARDRGLPVLQAQFVQLSPRQVELRVVVAGPVQASELEWMARQLESRSAGRFDVSTIVVSSIDREPSGKIRLVRGLTPHSTGSERAGD